MRFAIRGVRGPHAGSLFVLDQSILFGRAAHVDVQIVDDHVSRQHARLKLGPEGRPVLTDLRSKEGTFVGTEAVKSRPLEVGDSFRIGEAEYVLEQVEGNAAPPAKFEFKTNGHETLVATRVRKAPAQLALARARPAVKAVQSPGSAPELRVGSLATSPRPSTQPPAPGPGPAPIEVGKVGGRKAAAAVRELQELLGGEVDVSGSPTQSSSDLFGLEQPELELASAFDDALHDLGPQECALVQSVVEYRALKDRLERGRQVKEYERLQLAALERRFREGDPGLSASRRQWRRFDCRASGLAVVFRDLTSRTVPIALTDLGAGGARFLARDLVFTHGDVVSLIVDLSHSERRQAVFTSRIAWINQVDFAFGTIFCGPARLEARTGRRR